MIDDNYDNEIQPDIKVRLDCLHMAINHSAGGDAPTLDHSSIVNVARVFELYALGKLVPNVAAYDVQFFGDAKKDNVTVAYTKQQAKEAIPVSTDNVVQLTKP